jgi:hypothetical protein
MKTVSDKTAKEIPPPLSLAMPSTRLNFNSRYAQNFRATSTTDHLQFKSNVDDCRITAFEGHEDKSVPSVQFVVDTETTSRFSEDSTQVEGLREDTDGKAVWRWSRRNSEKLKDRLSDDKLDRVLAHRVQGCDTWSDGNERCFTFPVKEGNTEASWTSKSIKACRSRVNSISSTLRSRSDSIRSSLSLSLTATADVKDGQSEQASPTSNSKPGAQDAGELLARDVCRRLLLQPTKPDMQTVSHYMQKSLPPTPRHTADRPSKAVDEVRRSVTLPALCPNEVHSISSTPPKRRSALQDFGCRRTVSTSTLSSVSPATPMTPPLHVNSAGSDEDELTLAELSCQVSEYDHTDDANADHTSRLQLVTSAKLELEQRRTLLALNEGALFQAYSHLDSDQGASPLQQDVGDSAKPVSPTKRRVRALRQRSMDMLSSRRIDDRVSVEKSPKQQDNVTLNGRAADGELFGVIEAAPGWSRFDVEEEAVEQGAMLVLSAAEVGTHETSGMRNKTGRKRLFRQTSRAALVRIESD